MSISAAISNAVSGLGAVARGTAVVSSNLANTLTPGYAARELSLSPRGYNNGAGGVHVNGVNRIVPQMVLADYRLALAAQGKSDLTFAFNKSMETLVGTVDEADSLFSLVTNLGTALNLAAGSPDQDLYLQSVLESAQHIALKLNKISEGIQSERSRADDSIAMDVSKLNSSLSEVAKLNRLISTTQSKGQDASSLLDRRQSLIDNISSIVPLQEVNRPNGQIALFTKGGATLLDGNVPAVIGFTSSPHVTPNMTKEAGQLSGLTFNGQPLEGLQSKLFQGGSLEAAFHIRDVSGPNRQAQADAYARNIYERFASANIDPSLNPGEPGIFTDRQNAFDDSREIGFAGRIQISTLVDPGAGGHLWKIRDGLNAQQSIETSDSTLLIRMREAFDEHRPVTMLGADSKQRSMLSFSSDFMSELASERLKSESKHTLDSFYRDTLNASIKSFGVDSDKEIETLMQLERAYSANALVLQTANEMIDSILRIK